MEYIQFSGAAQAYGLRQLLQAEMSLLEILKRSQDRSKTNAEMQQLTTGFKKTLDALRAKLKEATLALPVIKGKPTFGATAEETLRATKKQDELEDEITIIRQKLALLGSG